MAPHFKQKKREDGLVEVHFDYCFMSTYGSPLAKILVAREKLARMTVATVVPMKGASVEYPFRRTFFPLKSFVLLGHHCEQKVGDFQD